MTTTLDDAKEMERAARLAEWDLCKQVAEQWLADTSDDRPDLSYLIRDLRIEAFRAGYLRGDEERKAAFEAGQASAADELAKLRELAQSAYRLAPSMATLTKPFANALRALAAAAEGRP